MKLRIAIVTESFLPVFNGVANSVVRVLETLRAEGHEAIVIAPTTPGDYYNGFRTYRVASLPFFQFQLGLPNPAVTKILEDFKPDVVHAASPVLLGAQAVNWAQRNGVPSVAVFQTDIAAYAERYGFKALRPLVDRAMANFHMPATINLAPTTEVRDYLTQLGLGNVQIWGRGVDLELYNPNLRFSQEVIDLKARFAPNGERIVGYVGRLAAEKQVNRYAELLELENTAFVIVGDGPERAALETLLDRPNVHFVGKQTGTELAKHYATMDVFAHFGTEETFGQTIQEAQASGAAVVAPAAGGPKFLIESGVSGYLADPTTRDAFNPFVENLVADDALRAKIAEGGRRSVLGKSWHANNTKLIAIYQEAMALTKQRTLKGLDSSELLVA